MKNIRVLLVDDHPVVREGLRSFLAGEPHIRVVGEAADGDQAILLAAELSPDVVLLDISMPGMNGIEAARRLRQVVPHTRILALSMYQKRHLVLEAIRAGVQGYVLKDAPPGELISAIAAVHEGKLFFSRNAGEIVVSDYIESGKKHRTPAGQKALTEREREVLALIAEGFSSRRIAERLGISPRTVMAHREHIMHKLDIHSVSGLTRYAMDTGIVRPD